MTRAYLRLDPAFDERKADYPDGPYAALVACICLAETQPERGRFRSSTFLRALLGKRGRHLPYLIAHLDLIEVDGSRLYLDGWDEWQEGDWKVADRLERVRNKRSAAGLRRNGTGARATVPGVPSATDGATPSATVGATDDRLDSAGAGLTKLSAGAGSPAPPSLECEPALDAYQRFYPSLSKEALTFLDELSAEFGQEWTARAIGEAGQEGRGKLLSRAKGLLILWARKSEKDEGAAERERNAAKRAPVKFEPRSEETPEERERREAAFQAMRSQIATIGLPGTKPVRGDA